MTKNNKVNAPKSVEVNTTKKQNVSGNRFTDTLKSSGANANMRLTLTDNAHALTKTNNPPRQVVLVCALLDDLGGSATVGELNELILDMMNDKHDSFWVDRKHEAYVLSLIHI